MKAAGRRSRERAERALDKSRLKAKQARRRFPAVDDMTIRCAECKWELDEFTAIAEDWLSSPMAAT